MQTHLFEITLEVKSHTFVPVLLLEVQGRQGQKNVLSAVDLPECTQKLESWEIEVDVLRSLVKTLDVGALKHEVMRPKLSEVAGTRHDRSLGKNRPSKLLDQAIWTCFLFFLLIPLYPAMRNPDPLEQPVVCVFFAFKRCRKPWNPMRRWLLFLGFLWRAA